MKHREFTVIICLIACSLFILSACSGGSKEAEREVENRIEHYGKAEIRDLSVTGDGKVKIKSGDKKNKVKVSFTLSKYAGQDLAFVNKTGDPVKPIEVKAEEGDSDVSVKCTLPNGIWMNRKKSVYRIKSFATSEIDESDTEEIVIRLKDQEKYYDRPVEGSMVWYGGAGGTSPGRSGTILATTGKDVIVRGDDGEKYRWAKADVMINMPDVRTDIIYDIYNAYSSRFFPIAGKAMYSNNGGKGLMRYDLISRDDAVHKNRKTGKTTFMVPVQWDFAKKVAKAQHLARKSGVSLYIVDSFRPMDSVGPVAKEVKDAGLLAPPGTSAHNFGMAVDTGWQEVDESGDPVGQPYDHNLQALDRKLAVQGPNGNSRESWWEGVTKLQQEWWHYGDTTLRAGYREKAVRVAALYVNRGKCLSRKRSRL